VARKALAKRFGPKSLRNPKGDKGFWPKRFGHKRLGQKRFGKKVFWPNILAKSFRPNGFWLRFQLVVVFCMSAKVLGILFGFLAKVLGLFGCSAQVLGIFLFPAKVEGIVCVFAKVLCLFFGFWLKC